MNTFGFTLRDYQKKAIADTYKLIRQSEKKILLFAPTGGGKTIIATKIVYDVVSRNKRVLFVVHRDILVGQTYNKFVSVGLKCGFFKAGWSQDLTAFVQIASVQTLPNREEWKSLNYDVIIFDECHLVAFSKVCLQMIKKIFPHAIYIGLTATPWRLSKRESLGDIYSSLVCTPMPKELIEAGFLVKPSYYGLDFDVDLDRVELSGGDYNPNQLSYVCDRPELINQLCSSWFELGYATCLSCPHCNYNFDLQKVITIRGRSQLLSAGDKEKLIFYREKLREGYQKNYAPTWAALNFKEKYGFLPPFDWGRGAIFDREKNAIEIYTQYLSQIAQRLNKDQAWIERYLYLEFG